MILANIGAPLVPTCILSFATVLFPGIVYYQTMTGKKLPVGKAVPLGGMLQMFFWVLLSFYWQPRDK